MGSSGCQGWGDLYVADVAMRIGGAPIRLAARVPEDLQQLEIRWASVGRQAWEVEQGYGLLRPFADALQICRAPLSARAGARYFVKTPGQFASALFTLRGMSLAHVARTRLS